MKGQQQSTHAGDASGLDESSLLVLEGLDALQGSEGKAAALADDPVRQRLMRRAAQSVRAAAAFHTVRGERDWLPGGDGVRSRWLYQTRNGRGLRVGEPLRARLLALAPGTRCELTLEQPGVRCEWLVMAGDVRIDGLPLVVRDYHVTLARRGVLALSSTGGALLYLREAEPPGDHFMAHTARDSELPWLAHAPGIERRVLWQRGSESALLYRVQPGSAVPRHDHGHDEECLMVEGEVFVDDILLRRGEYQLAPAGTHHEGVSSDTGGILYAHGDIDLAVTPR
jgi:quercetin dioxygenase-like cupin family protein